MGKLINQSWENGKKTNFGPNFGPFGPNLTAHPQLQKKKKKNLRVLSLLVVRNCSELSVYAISRKTNELHFIRKFRKTWFWARFWPVWLRVRPPNFLSWIFPLPVAKNRSKISSNAIYKKANEPNLRKLQKT